MRTEFPVHGAPTALPNLGAAMMAKRRLMDLMSRGQFSELMGVLAQRLRALQAGTAKGAAGRRPRGSTSRPSSAQRATKDPTPKRCYTFAK